MYSIFTMVWSAYCLFLESQQIIKIFEISPISRTMVRKKKEKCNVKTPKTLKTGEMLNMLNVFGGPLKKSARNRGNVKYVKS